MSRCRKLRENGFTVKGNYSQYDEIEVAGGQEEIIVFSYDFGGDFGAEAENLTFPPQGFKLSKKV